MPKRWIFQPRFDRLDELARAIGTGPLLTQVLANRGLTTPDDCRRFLTSGYEDLHRPERLPGLERAAERIVRAVRGGERIALYGDYDVDGLTSLAVLHQCLELAGATPTCYVPHRIEEGYGLNCDAVRALADQGHTLIVSVDCGITSLREATVARELGVDLIITDHHEPEHTLPDAYALVNPKLPGSDYPFRELAGAGVAFKLAWAVGLALGDGRNCSDEFRRMLTDATSLAALGTVADVVPLVDENRTLVTMGLKSLASRRFHPGLEAIVESAGLDGDCVRARDVAFIIAPRLNAAGRLGSADKALRLLTHADAGEAAEIARELETLNRERREIERRIFDEAVEIVEAGPPPGERFTLVLAGEGWHAGVIGIVASRLVERYHRPTLLVAVENGRGQGSGRSVPGFNMFETLEACDGLLDSFGGHAMAAGLRMDAGHVDELAAQFEARAREVLAPEDLVPAQAIDAETTLGALTMATVMELERLAPFGQANAQPVFALTGCGLTEPPRRIGKGGAHLALRLTQGGTSLRAVFWRAGQLADDVASAGTLDLACRVRVNEWKGRRTVELDIVDIHPGGYRDPQPDAT